MLVTALTVNSLSSRSYVIVNESKGPSSQELREGNHNDFNGYAKEIRGNLSSVVLWSVKCQLLTYGFLPCVRLLRNIA